MPDGRSPSQSAKQNEALSFENARVGPQTALVFENRDGKIIDEWINGDDHQAYAEVALLCYWLDEKIVSTPKPVRVAQVYQDYEDQPGEKISDIVLVRPNLQQAEPVAAMISRAVALTSVKHVRIVADTANHVVFTRLGLLLANCPLHSIHLSARLIDHDRQPIPETFRGAVIHQLPRDPWMPEIVRRRAFGSGPKPDHTPSVNRQFH
ncbi:hypothetical protein GB928_027705 [Shinella curvata]|uniref:Uncharacterized protein n=1 Tax=Shinella curvata TaxID=1817964 RepID=A0ABT8XMN0_9HYPH|nr:hypothetical protein [Shinella curvata]MCJ8057179.1 hypothetical protein [Shinella curvata]MDO6124974.1 hypothetical protein [Shinella curvata]